MGSIETHDGICRRLALASGLRIASLDYRLAPEHPYPAALEDVVAAIDWLCSLGGDHGCAAGRIGLAGDSAGATLALAAALRLRDEHVGKIAWLGLIYGAYGRDFTTSSYQAFGGETYGLPRAAMEWFWSLYAADASAADPYVAPLGADLHGLPPAFVSVAAFDPLRDEGMALAQRLIAAGVDVTFRLWRGVTHGSLHWASRVPAIQGFIEEIAILAAMRLGHKDRLEREGAGQ